MVVLCYSDKKIILMSKGYSETLLSFLRQHLVCSFLLVMSHESLVKLSFKADTSSFSDTVTIKQIDYDRLVLRAEIVGM